MADPSVAKSMAAACTSFIALPYEDTWPLSLRATMYMLGLLYCFLGLGLIAQKYMDAMDNIVKQTRTVSYRDDELGVVVTREERIWNPTIADITLLALGTSAPPISLAIISAIQQLGQASTGADMGTGTMFGGAAFNFFAILACCILIPRRGTIKRVANFGVFLVELAWSIWAYIWLYIVFQVWTPGEVTLLEGLLTVLHLPVLMLHAYAQDQQWHYLSIPGLDGTTRALPPRETRECTAKVSLLSPDHQPSDSFLHHAMLAAPLPPLAAKASLFSPISALEGFRPEVYDQLVKGNKLPVYSPHDAVEDLSTVSQTKSSISLPSQNESQSDLGLSPLVMALASSSGSGSGSGTPELGWTESSDSAGISQFVLENRLPVLSLPCPDALEIGPRCNTVDSEACDGARERPDTTLGGRAPSERIHDSGEAIDGAELFVSEPGMRRRGPCPLVQEDGATTVEWWRLALGMPAGSDDAEQREIPASDNEVERLRGFLSQGPAPLARQNSVPFSESGQGLLSHSGWPKARAAGRRGTAWSLGGSVLQLFGLPRGDLSASLPPESSSQHDQLREQWKLQIVQALKGSSPQQEQERQEEHQQQQVAQEVPGSRHLQQGHEVQHRPEALHCPVRPESGVYLFEVKAYSDLCSEEDWSSDCGSKRHPSRKTAPTSPLMEFLWGCWRVVSYFWRVLFALFVPPADVGQGWPAFLMSIVIISIISTFVIALSNLLGCVTGVDSFVISVVLLASGTSVPNIIASAIAAHHSPTADSAIANINASNSINVYLGLGLPWVITAAYDSAVLGEPYTIDSSTLGPSLLVYFGAIALGLLVLFARRWLVGGELGGNSSFAVASSLTLIGLWVAYCIFSMLLFFHVL